MKKLTFFLSLFLGCFWLFGYIDYPETYSQERPELLNTFFSSNKINDLLSNSQRQRLPKRKKHDWFHSSRISSTFQGNSETVWARTYGGSGSDEVYAIQQTSDGGYIVAGKTRSFATGTKAWILKLSSGGEIEWQRTYKGGIYTYANLVQQTSDDGYIVAGFVAYESYPYADMLVLKLFSNGDVEWVHNYEGYHGDIAHSIQQTSDGGYIVAGLTGSFGDPDFKDIQVLKLSSNGEVEWQCAYGGPSYESEWANDRQRVTVLETSDNGYILAGDTQSFGAGESDIWILKLSSVGDVEWQKTYGGQGSDVLYRCGPNIQLTDDGGCIIAGDTLSFGAGGVDIWVLKLSSVGDVEWQRTYGGEDDERSCSIRLTSDGGYIVAGFTKSFGLLELDFWLLKLSATGDVEWQKTYGGEGHDEARCLYHTSDGGYILAGNTWSFGAGESDILILKLSPNGELGLGSEFLVGNSRAKVSDTHVVPVDTYVTPVVTSAPAMDPDITVENASAVSNVVSYTLNLPPINLSLKSEVNRSLFKQEALHTLSWSPNPANSQFLIVEYKIYRKNFEGGTAIFRFIESVPGNTFEYVDHYSDPEEDIAYVVTSVNSDGNESPKSRYISSGSGNNTVSNSEQGAGSATTRTSSSDKRITRLDTKPSEAKKNISENILVSSKPLYKSPDKSQTLIQPPANVSLIRGEASQTIHWKHRKQNVAEYRIYRKCAGDDDESYMLIGWASGTESKFVDYVPDSYEEFVYALSAVDLDGNESQKSKAIR